MANEAWPLEKFVPKKPRPAPNAEDVLMTLAEFERRLQSLRENEEWLEAQIVEFHNQLAKEADPQLIRSTYNGIRSDIETMADQNYIMNDQCVLLLSELNEELAVARSM